MRQIKFRGKRIRPEGVEDAWVYGSLIQRIETTEIHDSVFTWNVDPDTVSQFTGLVDRNGKEVYEGDIVSFPLKRRNFLVMWNDDLCVYQFSDGSLINSGDNYSVIIFVVGNAFDNPELLNEKQ